MSGFIITADAGRIATATMAAVARSVTAQPPSVMWSKDRAYATQARGVDGRICINNPIRKYSPTESPCGGDAQACLWKFIQVDKECSALTYGSVLFQVDRYIWAQGQLAGLLANQPGGGIAAQGNDPRYATAWVDWCRQVMQLVSLARWSTNIRPEYLPDVDEMPEATRVGQMLDQRLPAGAPSKLHQEDLAPAQNQYLRVLCKPSMKPAFQDVCFQRSSSDNSLAVSLPVAPADFDPALTCSGYGDLLRPRFREGNPSIAPAHTRPGFILQTSWDVPGPDTGTTVANSNPWPWPWSWCPLVIGRDDTITRRLQLWFSTTLGFDYWVAPRANGQIRAQYHTRWNGPGADLQCSGGGATASLCSMTSWVKFWWGTAAAQISMCEAWAKDVVNTSFENLVATGLQNFIDTYSRIPDNLKILDYDTLTALKGAVSASKLQDATNAFMTATGLVAAGVGAVQPIAGAVIGAVGLLMQGVTELLKALKLLAYGGGELVGACIPPPVFRMIQTVDSHACDFNTADGEMAATVDRVSAIQSAAAAGLPVSVWHDVAQTASGETQPQSVLQQIASSAPPKSNTGLWVLGALALGAGAIVVYKATR